MNEIPSHISDLENLTIIEPKDGTVPDSVTLIRETVFESSDDVFIEEYNGKVDVDGSGRVENITLYMRLLERVYNNITKELR
jgi:hypothetical protein